MYVACGMVYGRVRLSSGSGRGLLTGVHEVSGFFDKSSRYGVIISRRGGRVVLRMAVRCGKFFVETRTEGRSLRATTSVYLRGLSERVEGGGAHLRGDLHNNNFRGCVPLVSRPRSVTRRRRFGVVGEGEFISGPVSTRRTILRVGVLKRSFFIFTTPRALRAGVMCQEGSKGCNLVRTS